MTNNDRKYVALIETEFEQAEDELNRYPMPVPPVMKPAEVEGYIRNREIALGKYFLLKRMKAMAEALILNQ